MFDRDSIRGFSALITLVGVASSLGFSFNAPAFSQATSNNLPLLLAQKSEKVRVAVLDFDYSGLSNPQWLTFFNGGASGVSDILVNKLVESGRYTVIERSRIDAVLREQNFGASGRVDAATAAQIGQILGVDVVIIGSITQFDLQKKQSGGSFIIFSTAKTETDAFVKLNVRAINTTTAEIITTAQGDGSANQSDGSTVVLGVGGGSQTSNEGKLLSIATDKAVAQVVDNLNDKADQIAATPRSLPTVTALVAAVAGNQVILNKGTGEGYRVGLRISIERTTQTVKDPQTGKVIRQITQPIGTLEIVEADGQSSVGRIITGNGFKIGDLAKPIR
ncbi:CsgG/HfaB family protein [Microcystis ichthyoblabe FBCC-A1114]|uniref:CsgG/HfaB family protein n=1 Tax=Microcystis TaxID=1125 RepID=UPI003D289B5E